ncbi:anionic trypsin-2-like [Eleginops maclovinus]|uniref:anionic trypsin-2-like n=1 Tax=Eleginops maclovinus TaxID=56733 RepID=UPI003080446B
MAGMMTGLLLLLLAGVTESRVVDLQKRIIGGVECAKTDRLYHVKLHYTNLTQRSLCGGSLISKDWILTAGHCHEQPGSCRTATAVLRVHPGAQARTVVITAPPEFMIDNDGRHDIMLLRLPAPEPGFPTATLPDCSSRPALRATVQVAGYAATTAQADGKKGGLPSSPTLQCADTTVVACVEKVCPLFKLPNYYNNNKVFCYKRDNVDTSPGDSGGGVVFNGMIYGVHIRGGKYACDTPGMAMDVCEYRDWITRVTGIAFPLQSVTG